MLCIDVTKFLRGVTRLLPDMFLRLGLNLPLELHPTGACSREVTQGRKNEALRPGCDFEKNEELPMDFGLCYGVGNRMQG